MSGSLKSSLAGGEGEGEDQGSSSLTFGPSPLGDQAFSTFCGPFVEDQWLSRDSSPPAVILDRDHGDVLGLGFGLGLSDWVE